MKGRAPAISLKKKKQTTIYCVVDAAPALVLWCEPSCVLQSMLSIFFTFNFIKYNFIQLHIILFNCSIVIKTIAKFRHWIPGPRKKERTDLTMQGISHHCQLSLIHAFPNIIAYPTCLVYSFSFLTVSSLAIPPNWSAHTFPIFKEVLTFL